jgi:hypothetical protein
VIGAYPKINFRACESHALKHRDDFRCATDGILGYALSEACDEIFAGLCVVMCCVILYQRVRSDEKTAF